MTELWIAVLLTGGIVVAVDLSTTLLRKRARREPTSPRLSPVAPEPGRLPDEGAARDDH
jgi:hypothetical protein